MEYRFYLFTLISFFSLVFPIKASFEPLKHYSANDHNNTYRDKTTNNQHYRLKKVNNGPDQQTIIMNNKELQQEYLKKDNKHIKSSRCIVNQAIKKEKNNEVTKQAIITNHNNTINNNAYSYQNGHNKKKFIHPNTKKMMRLFNIKLDRVKSMHYKNEYCYFHLKNKQKPYNDLVKIFPNLAISIPNFMADMNKDPNLKYDWAKKVLEHLFRINTHTKIRDKLYVGIKINQKIIYIVCKEPSEMSIQNNSSKKVEYVKLLLQSKLQENDPDQLLSELKWINIFDIFYKGNMQKFFNNRPIYFFGAAKEFSFKMTPRTIYLNNQPQVIYFVQLINRLIDNCAILTEQIPIDPLNILVGRYVNYQKNAFL